MSDTESVAAAPHPTHAGKSLKSIERPRYKSWRKKYRKMRSTFDISLEDNKRMFKEEQKLECIAKRLREELDGLLELCLDLNQNPSLPPQLRFDVRRRDAEGVVSRRGKEIPTVVPATITPQEANAKLREYTTAVQAGRIPPIDLKVIREQIDEALAAQDVETLDDLEARVPHALAAPLPEGVSWKGMVENGDEPPAGYLTSEQEGEYLDRLDARLGGDAFNLSSSSAQRTKEQPVVPEEKHWAELTPRELERQAELLNPQSQHNWLRTHVKSLAAADAEDNESLASASHPDNAGKVPIPRKRPGTTKSTLARQVGDRAVERAREGWSPSAASGMEEDELALDEGGFGSVKKKGRDPDGTYRLKGGKGGGGSSKGKRKRSGEDIGRDRVGAQGGVAGVGWDGEKRAKVEPAAGLSAVD